MWTMNCPYEATIVEEPQSLVCGPTVEKATILYSRGTLLIVIIIVDLIDPRNKVIFWYIKIPKFNHGFYSLLYNNISYHP